MMDNIFSSQSRNLQAIAKGTIETASTTGTTDQVYVKYVLKGDLGDNKDLHLPPLVGCTLHNQNNNKVSPIAPDHHSNQDFEDPNSNINDNNEEFKSNVDKEFKDNNLN